MNIEFMWFLIIAFVIGIVCIIAGICISGTNNDESKKRKPNINRYEEVHYGMTQQ